MRSSYLLAIPLLLASGCATNYTPRIVTADELGITYQVPNDRQQEARETAQEYCQARNRTAELRTVTPTGNNQSTLRFSCI